MQLIYMWVEKYKCLDDFGINLSSEYIINKSCTGDGKIKIEVGKNANYNEAFFSIGSKSTCIKDIIALVGKNGSGKTTALDAVIRIAEHKDLYTSKYIAIYSIDGVTYAWVNNISDENVDLQGCICMPVEQKNDILRNNDAKPNIFFYSNIYDFSDTVQLSCGWNNISTNSLVSRYSTSSDTQQAINEHNIRLWSQFLLDVGEQEHLRKVFNIIDVNDTYDAKDDRFVVRFPQKSTLTLNDSQDWKIPDNICKIFEVVGIPINNSWFHFWDHTMEGLTREPCKTIFLERMCYCLLKSFFLYSESKNTKEIYGFNSLILSSIEQGVIELDDKEGIVEKSRALFIGLRDILLDYYVNFYKAFLLPELIKYESPFSNIYTQTIDEYIKINAISAVDNVSDKARSIFSTIYSSKCHIPPGGEMRNHNWRANEMDNFYENLLCLLDYCLGAIAIMQTIETTENIDFSSLNTRSPAEIIIDAKTALYLVNVSANLRLSSAFIFDAVKKLSTGEVAILNQYTRFYDALQATINWLSNESDGDILYIAIDECDSYKHPDLQRRCIYDLIGMVNALFSNRQVVILITTHSPIVLSDIPHTNIVYMENGKTVDKHPKTLAQNIYMLFSDSFYMQDVIGEFARSKIEQISQKLKGSDYIEEFSNDCEKFIELVGEPILKEMLNRKLKEYKSKKSPIKTDSISNAQELFKKMTDSEKASFIDYIKGLQGDSDV